MTVDVVRDVPDTAFLVAAYRAIEQERDKPLFRDPFAAELAGQRGREIATKAPKAFLGGWTVAVRTVIIDAYVREAIDRGCDMIINLGAGLDARPYRMELPSALAWIEVDLPHMLDHKRERLASHAPQCALEQIACDLADRPARQALFAQLGPRAKSALVLTEGLLPYLSNDEVASFADDLHAHAGFTRWIVEYFSPALMRFRRRKSRQLANAPFKFYPPDWFGLFAEHGWLRDDLRYIPEVGERLGRPMPLGRIAKLVLSVLVPGMKHGIGYALLARKT